MNRTVTVDGVRITIKQQTGSLPEITFRRPDGTKKHYRGSSLQFSRPLAAEDRKYLKALIAD